MHGIEETTTLPRTIWTLTHLGMLGSVAWIYFGQGTEIPGNWFQQNWQVGDPIRKCILLSCGVVLWVRMTVTAFVFLKRKFAWSECLPVIGAVGMYQLGFAFLGATTFRSVDTIDFLAVGIFILGSILNTGSEWQRKRFKDNPQNRGKLFTQGLFRVVRHPKYLGDILWVTGWAIITRNNWAIIIPIICTAGFVFIFIPQLSDYLSSRYENQFQQWAKRTKILIPLVYKIRRSLANKHSKNTRIDVNF